MNRRSTIISCSIISNFPLSESTGSFKKILLASIVVTLSLLTTFVNASAQKKPSDKKPPVSATSKPTKKPAVRRHVNQLGGMTFKHGILSPFGSWFDVLRPKPGQFTALETFTITGTLVREDGKPVPDLTVWFFMLGKDDSKSDIPESWEADLYLGTEDKKLTFVNPKGKSDAEGRFTISMGPAWKEVKRAILGFVVSVSPDKPFDVQVLPFLEDGKVLEFTPTAEKPNLDIGKIVVEEKFPLPSPK